MSLFCMTQLKIRFVHPSANVLTLSLNASSQSSCEATPRDVSAKMGLMGCGVIAVKLAGVSTGSLVRDLGEVYRVRDAQESPHRLFSADGPGEQLVHPPTTATRYSHEALRTTTHIRHILCSVYSVTVVPQYSISEDKS